MIVYYLYKKTHKTTNVKYLGFTRKNPYKYKGSGIRWISHIKQHGNDVETEVLYETSNHSKIKTIGKFYSQLWNVVDSREWANLKPETGEGGGVPGMHKGKSRPKEHIEAMKQGWQRAKEDGYQPWNKGKTGIYRSGKPVFIIAPNGEQYHYERLKDGCKELGLIYCKMSSVNTGKLKDWKGWTVKPVNTL